MLSHTRRRKHRLHTEHKRRRRYLHTEENGTRSILESLRAMPRVVVPVAQPTVVVEPKIIRDQPKFDIKSSHHAIEFPPETFTRPGEYGKPDIDGGKTNGFAVVHHPKLNGQRIFISSSLFTKELKREYRIPEVNHINLLSCHEFKDAIPEKTLSAVKGLKLFRMRMQKIYGAEGDILINCLRGANRSPVAALIYMVDHGIPYPEAYESLMAAMRVRFPEFKINPYDNYNASLELLEQSSADYEEAIVERSRAYSMPILGR